MIGYTEEKGLDYRNTNIKNVSYRYVNNKNQAIDLAKHTYYNECRQYNIIKLRTNNLPFLELEDIVKVDYGKYKDDYQIIAINQTNTYTELILKQYREYQGNDNNVITEISTRNNNEKSLAQIEKEKKQQEDKIASIESNLTKLNNELKLDISERLSKNDIKLNEFNDILTNKIVELERKEIEFANFEEFLKELIK